MRRTGIDIVCLAGFLRVLTPWFVAQWNGRLINIHPSLLPAFKGLHTHERALAAGAKSTARRSTSSCRNSMPGRSSRRRAVPVLPGDTPDSLAARVLEVEHRIYPAALQARRRGNVQPEIKTPGGAGGCVICGRTIVRRPPQATLRFSAEVLPRLLTSSYSTV